MMLMQVGTIMAETWVTQFPGKIKTKSLMFLRKYEKYLFSFYKMTSNLLQRTLI